MVRVLSPDSGAAHLWPPHMLQHHHHHHHQPGHHRHHRHHHRGCQGPARPGLPWAGLGWPPPPAWPDLASTFDIDAQNTLHRGEVNKDPYKIAWQISTRNFVGNLTKRLFSKDRSVMTLVTIGGLVAAVLGSAGLRQLRLASPAFQPQQPFQCAGPVQARTRPGYTNLSSGAVTLESHWSLQHNNTLSLSAGVTE